MPDSPDGATAKSLLRRNPRAWVEFLLGREVEPHAGAIYTKPPGFRDEHEGVVHISQPDPWIVHVEIQGEYDPELPLHLLSPDWTAPTTSGEIA